MHQGGYLATTFQGLEDILAHELQQLGATRIKKRKRAVLFDASDEVFYKVNYLSRVAIRILKPLFEFRARTYDEFYKRLKNTDWARYFHYDQTFAVSAVVKSRLFKNSQFTALKTKDAIVDAFRDRFSKRPFVQTYQPDIRIHIFINRERVRVLLDASGESLHKRGYRQDHHFPAPLSECLAAGMLLLAGWEGQSDFVDPMCGSGTLLVEAGMIARHIPAQRYRSYFSFHHWPGFDAKLWKKIKTEAKATERNFTHTITGYDINPAAVRAAQANLRGAGLKAYTPVQVADLRKLPVHTPPGLLVTNPPYGDKIKADDIFDLYRQIGDTLKHQFNGWEAWIFSANKEALKHIGLKTARRIPLYNGPKEARLCKYEIW